VTLTGPPAGPQRGYGPPRPFGLRDEVPARRTGLGTLGLLDDFFAKVCSDFGATLVECNGNEDHVHLLIEYPPTVAISGLVNFLKGVSSRRPPTVRDAHPPEPPLVRVGPRRTPLSSGYQVQAQHRPA
jgi:putative transposase